MNWKNKESKKFIQAILALETTVEAERFLRDLMTENEIAEFGKRLQAAEMLSNKIPYSLIEEKTGLSSATIARVAKWLNGKDGGYRTILSKIHHHNPIKLEKGLY